MKQENFVENIPGILLLSHGPFCQALLESAQMIGGEAVNVVALPLLDAGLPKRTAFAVGALSALVEPVFGVLAALAVTVAQPLMPWLLGFAAGAMLLVTVRELIPEACGGAKRAGTLSVLAGFLLMMILDVALG